MSTKNITYVNRETYLEKSEEMLLSLSDAYFNKKRFLLGEGADRDKVIFYLQMNTSLCTENCEMLKFINNKIKGAKSHKKPKNIDIIKPDFGEGNTYNITQVIREEFEWENVEW